MDALAHSCESRFMKHRDWSVTLAWVTRVGVIVMATSLFLAFSMAFATQDGTDVESKTAAAVMFAALIPVGALMAAMGSVGKRWYDRRSSGDRR